MIRATILIETILNSCLEQRARSRLMQSIREPALILYEGESEAGNSAFVRPFSEKAAASRGNQPSAVRSYSGMLRVLAG